MTGPYLTPDELKRMGKKAGCAALALRHPAHSHRWYSRNWHKLLTMTDPELSYCVAHRDPTGEAAVNNVIRFPSRREAKAA